LPDIALLAAADQAAAADPPPDIPDDRLRLIFTCCHPALEPKSRVALTLRTLGGLTTSEIARAFLDREATMGQRLSRAKAKIAGAGIAYAVPDPADLSARLESVLSVIYLIFNEGYAATEGAVQVRVGLCQEAIYLGQMLDELIPDTAEIQGLLSLMQTTHARRLARTNAGGDLVPLDAQDRSLWDDGLIAAGLGALDRALARGQPGPYQIRAAISALHVQADTYAQTDWPQMFLLYDALLNHDPSPVVRLNQAVVLAEMGGVTQSLAIMDELSDALDVYQPFHAAHAHVLAQLGHHAAAYDAFERAIEMSGTDNEIAYLRARQSQLADRSGAEKKAGHKGPAKSNREV
jgi:RNA polymerase sigma-70 factor (ECF subfamily)